MPIYEYECGKCGKRSSILTLRVSEKVNEVCRHCGAPMLVIETFARAQHIRGPPASARPP